MIINHKVKEWSHWEEFEEEKDAVPLRVILIVSDKPVHTEGQCYLQTHTDNVISTDSNIFAV